MFLFILFSLVGVFNAPTQQSSDGNFQLYRARKTSDAHPCIKSGTNRYLNVY
jgi:hypothetical protein